MKILVIGLDGAEPERLLGDERLENVRRLMDAGCYGRFEDVGTAGSAAGWTCLETGCDPGADVGTGAAGVAHESSGPAESPETEARAIWDVLARAGRRSVRLGLPLGGLPCSDHGLGLALTLPWPPPPVASESGHDQARRHFALVRQLLQAEEWDDFHFVEPSLNSLYQALHPERDAGRAPQGPEQDAIRDHYQLLDREIGAVLELLTEDTLVLVVSLHDDGGAARDQVPQGGFILACSALPPLGPIGGVRLLDMAPTLLALAGCDIPATMPGRPLATDPRIASPADPSPLDEEELIRERLRGLGYIA